MEEPAAISFFFADSEKVILGHEKVIDFSISHEERILRVFHSLQRPKLTKSIYV
jgi:hypothetical protein